MRNIEKGAMCLPHNIVCCRYETEQAPGSGIIASCSLICGLSVGGEWHQRQLYEGSR